MRVVLHVVQEHGRRICCRCCAVCHACTRQHGRECCGWVEGGWLGGLCDKVTGEEEEGAVVELPTTDCPLTLSLACPTSGLAVALVADDWVLQHHRPLTMAARPECGWSNSCSTINKMPYGCGVSAGQCCIKVAACESPCGQKWLTELRHTAVRQMLPHRG